jgi:collagenase-like PrtC family protease
MAWDVWRAGADALIVQDMGLLELDLPPIQLHASTQTDIRTPAKARFLQDVGFADGAGARTGPRPDPGHPAQVQDAVLEFFVHGALCVAYSGQCYISHALTGRSANRGSCSQECRQAYTVTDGAGRIVAHDKHVLSLKDNDQSHNLPALVDAGIRSFKIEGRYKDMATVKNVTAHYRQLLDALLDRRPDLAAASSGRCSHHFTPDPQRGFNRGATDYFVNGRQADIGAFDSPKHAGMPVGDVVRVGPDHFDLNATDRNTVLNNGDALTWWDLQGELQGVPVNVARHLGGRGWRIEPNAPMAAMKDLKRGTAISRNRDMAWDRLLDRPSAERLIGVDLVLQERDAGLRLQLTDADGHRAHVDLALIQQPAKDALRAESDLRERLAKLGGTEFDARSVTLAWSRPWFLPAATANALRRDAVAALRQARAAAFERLPRAQPVSPGVPYPEDSVELPGQRPQPARGRLLRAPRRARHRCRLREPPGTGRSQPDDHAALRALQPEPVPQAGQGRDRRAGHVRAEPLTLAQGKDR